MIDLTKVRKYYIACGYTDLRCGIDGLAAVVTQQYGGQLTDESLFLFCGRRTDRIKALYWSGDGYILLYKRFLPVLFPVAVLELSREDLWGLFLVE